MWIPFDSNDISNQMFKNYPPEGRILITTDGECEAIMFFILSSQKWYYHPIKSFINPNSFEDDIDDYLSNKWLIVDNQPFQPTHWMYLGDYKMWKRDQILNNLL